MFFGLLALPALVQLVRPPAPDILVAENRRAAPPPNRPHSVAEALQLPRQVDAWLTDRFGLRTTLVLLNARVRWLAFGEVSSSPDLVIGRHGRFFLGAHAGAPPDSLITQVCDAAAADGGVKHAADSVRRVLAGARAAGLDPTVLIVPTPARLYAEDLPERLIPACTGRTPLGDAVAADLTGEDVIYPVAALLAMKARMAVVPPRHFHWAGEAPLRIAELVAEVHWGLPRSLPLSLAHVSRASDLNFLAPGAGMTDMIDAPQRRPAGVRTCRATECGVPGLPPDAAAPLEIHRRPGPGIVLVIGDSFGDEIAPDFVEQFGEVWHVQINLLRGMNHASQRSLGAVLRAKFRGERVLVVVHDLGTASAFDQVVNEALGVE